MISILVGKVTKFFFAILLISIFLDGKFCTVIYFSRPSAKSLKWLVKGASTLLVCNPYRCCVAMQGSPYNLGMDKYPTYTSNDYDGCFYDYIL